MKITKIDWCDCTLNPVIGCTFGCSYCYARRINDRFHFIEDYSKPQFFPDRLKALNSKTPKTIFMDSMSDIADWTDEWIKLTFDCMKNNPQHTYLFLTKRPEHFVRILKDLGRNEIPNLWFGQSLPTLKKYKYDWAVPKHFLSIEPLQYAPDENICLGGTGWVIIGAETGNRKDKIIPKKEWIDNIVDQCKKQSIPVFMKSSIKELMGDDFIQEFPWGDKE